MDPLLGLVNKLCSTSKLAVESSGKTGSTVSGCKVAKKAVSTSHWWVRCNTAGHWSANEPACRQPPTQQELIGLTGKPLIHHLVRICRKKCDSPLSLGAGACDAPVASAAATCQPVFVREEDRE